MEHDRPDMNCTCTRRFMSGDRVPCEVGPRRGPTVEQRLYLCDLRDLRGENVFAFFVVRAAGI